MNILYIDTTNNKEIVIKLEAGSKIFVERAKASRQMEQAALPSIVKVFKKAKVNISEIDMIKVKKGPGSFTGLRVGASIANALSFALGAKVNGKNLGELVEPRY